MKMIKLAIVFLMAFSLIWAKGSNAEVVAVQPGDVLKVNLTDSSGSKVSIPAPKGVKATVVVFWMPESSACMKELKRLNKITAKRSGVQVLAITRGKGTEERKDAEDTLKKAKISFRAVYDPDLKAAKQVFNVTAVPAVYVADAKGRAVTSMLLTSEGRVRNLTFEQLLDNVVAGKSVPALEGIPVDWENEAGTRQVIGKAAPDFSLRDDRGALRSPQSYKGRNLLLVFWNPGCPHCRRELPRLQQFYQTEGKQLGFEVLAVSTATQPEEVKEASAFIRSAGVRYPVIVEGGATLGGPYGIKAVPVCFVINKKGIVVEVITGEHPALATVYRSLLADSARMGGK